MAESIDTRGTFHQVEPFEDSGAETSVAILEQLEWEEEQRRQKERGRCRCHWKYPCTIPGIVKIVEMILDMIAFLCVACSDWYADFHSTYRFFEFVSMTTFWITLTLMVLYITLTIFMCPINWSLFEFIYCCIAVILYIFASCFLAARAYNIGGLAAGTVFGFFAAIAYAVGALVSWWECRHPEWDLRGLGEEDSWLRGGTPWWAPEIQAKRHPRVVISKEFYATPIPEHCSRQNTPRSTPKVQPKPTSLDAQNGLQPLPEQNNVNEASR
ncbi:PREDICTED: CKLF-like MARVEL transmembrane domain-containing protein 4 [Branchiostoma belcheri]|uniref:CKLF-like MARVEL transmembrane domain-containing protein 4 n=1 Tax=Branchiostoma belcheri TaxID=7741 RepID=A0A6P4YMH1_BRABE|nr:PREDICTED: CKLF-like MARVEL transmembrane domain-containing protein 4 [Branchiostoma belcheri]